MKLRNIGYCLSDAFHLATWGLVIAGVVGGGALYFYGLGDSDNGRKTLEGMGAKVIENKGHPAFGGPGLFSTRFTIEMKDGKREDVVVSHGLSTQTSITFKNR